MAVFLLIVSLGLLTLGAEILVRGSVGAAARLRLSPLFIGMTIVGFGTSTPELATGIAAAVQQRSDINVGNVVGSNICNIALILGAAALIMPIPLRARGLRNEAAIVAIVAFVPFVVLLTGEVTRWLGVVFVIGLAGYLLRGYRAGRTEANTADEVVVKPMGVLSSGMMILGGIALLAVASQVLVSSASDLASRLGISELAIALTVVAFGTSAPELFTSVVAAIRGRSEIAVGNILGSNVFNILGILGITAIIRPQEVSPQVFFFDAPVMAALSLGLFGIVAVRSNISRPIGAVFIAVYVLYCTALLVVVPQWSG